jgi:YggT family protein
LNSTVAGLFTIFIYFLIVAIIVRSLMSWFPVGRDNPFARIVFQVTEPLLEPVRRIMPRTGMIDFSAMVVIVVLYVMLTVINQVSA